MQLASLITVWWIHRWNMIFMVHNLGLSHHLYQLCRISFTRNTIQSSLCRDLSLLNKVYETISSLSTLSQREGAALPWHQTGVLLLQTLRGLAMTQLFRLSHPTLLRPVLLYLPCLQRKGNLRSLQRHDGPTSLPLPHVRMSLLAPVIL